MNGRHAQRLRPGVRAARALSGMIKGATWAGSRIPTGVAHTFAAAGGTIEWAARPGKRRQLAENLGHAIGMPPNSSEVREIVREEIKNEAHRSADLLWALGRQEEFLATTKVHGVEHAHEVLNSGEGMVLVGTHLGGWEVATSIPAHHFPCTTHVIVANDWIARAIEHARSDAGLEVVYSGRAAFEGVDILKRGDCLLMLGDDASFGKRTHRVRFLDAEAELPAGTVTLARLAQSPLVNFSVLPLGRRRWEVGIDPPIGPPASKADEARVLQLLADRWSEQIRSNPQHWAAPFPIRWCDEGTS